MIADQIGPMIRSRADAEGRAARLLHAELRARHLYADRRVELASTPMSLATPGSLTRWLEALKRLGDSADHNWRRADRLREQRDRLLLTAF